MTLALQLLPCLLVGLLPTDEEIATLLADANDPDGNQEEDQARGAKLDADENLEDKGACSTGAPDEDPLAKTDLP